jgi:hypothetical protein
MQKAFFRQKTKIMPRSLPKEPLFSNKKQLKQAREDKQAHGPGKRSILRLRLR